MSNFNRRILMTTVILMVLFRAHAQDSEIQLYYEDRLVGFTWEDLMKEFGMPSERGERRIGLGYPLYIADPDYLEYFSREEMRKTLVIYVLVWEFKSGESEPWRVVAYLKYANGKWRTFSSLEYNPEITEF